MKIVIDSNIFVSSFFWVGHPREVFERVINGLDELFIAEIKMMIKYYNALLTEMQTSL